MKEIIENTFGIVTDIFSEFKFGGKKTEYDADFGTSGLLSRWNKGFRLGRQSLPIAESCRNLLLYGGSGSGKNARIFSRSLWRLSDTSSCLINDPSSTEYNQWSRALHNKGVEIKRVHFAFPTYGGYNPLKRIKTTADIKKISKLLIQNALGQSKDPFWNLSGETIISILIRYVINYAPEDCKTLSNVLSLLNMLASDGKKIDRLFAKIDEVLYLEYKSFMSYDSKTLSNIIATAKAALQIFSDPEVALATSYDTLEIDTWRQKPTAIFINNSVPEMRYYTVLTSLLITQVLSEILGHLPSAGDKPIYLLLDEAFSLNLEGVLPIAIANCRKYKSGILAVYQSPSQLVHQYGQAGAKGIEENAFTKVYMPGVDLQTAMQLEHIMGKFEFENEKGKQVRSLMLASEIRELREESLIVMDGHRVIKKRLTPFYESLTLRQLTKQAPLELPNLLPFTTTPTLKLG